MHIYWSALLFGLLLFQTRSSTCMNVIPTDKIIHISREETDESISYIAKLENGTLIKTTQWKNGLGTLGLSPADIPTNCIHFYMQPPFQLSQDPYVYADHSAAYYLILKKDYEETTRKNKLKAKALEDGHTSV